jgi:hypothetical protein
MERVALIFFFKTFRDLDTLNYIYVVGSAISCTRVALKQEKRAFWDSAWYKIGMG